MVKVSNPIYGFDHKLFRITRVRETEGEDGTLACEITAIEYSESVYVDSTLTDLTYKPISDIPSAQSSASLPPPSAPLISTGTGASSISLSTQIAAGSQPVSSVEFYYSNTNTGNVNWLTTVAGNFVAGDTVTGESNQLPAGTYYFRARTGTGESHSELSDWSLAFYTSGQYSDYGDISGGGP